MILKLLTFHTVQTVVLGVIASFLVFYLFTWHFDRSAAAGKKWAQKEIHRRLPLACLASPW